MPESAHFGPSLFKFLKDLRENNDRKWFEENKARYETEVKEPILAFISDFDPLLRKAAPQFIADARPVGGSMFRIYRDVRFSKDKSPYKTAASMHFRHLQGKDVHAPGFYLHLEPGSCFSGIGLWHPETKALARIRDRIVDDPKSFQAAISKKSFRETWTLSGESLKRPPRGYDPDHPMIEHLMRKDHTAMCSLTQKEVCAPGFLKEFARQCKAAAPFMSYLTESIGLSY